MMIMDQYVTKRLSIFLAIYLKPSTLGRHRQCFQHFLQQIFKVIKMTHVLSVYVTQTCVHPSKGQPAVRVTG
jgi:hypothetical protein